VPKKSNLKDRMRTNDIFFLDFVRNLLHLDPYRRFSAEEALEHPWLRQAKYDDGL
jgi:serine/threonine protein kinase